MRALQAFARDLLGACEENAVRQGPSCRRWHSCPGRDRQGDSSCCSHGH